MPKSKKGQIKAAVKSGQVASSVISTGQAEILHNLKFDFNTSSPVIGRQRNSFEQMKERTAKIINY